MISVPLELVQPLSMSAMTAALVGGAVWLAAILLGVLVSLRVVRALPPNAVFSIRLGPGGLRLAAARGLLSIEGGVESIAAIDSAGGSAAISQDGVGGTADPRPGSWQAFVKAHHAKLMNDTAMTCLIGGVPRDGVEEVFQEAVIGLAQSWDRLGTAAGGSRAYLHGIVRKKILDLVYGRRANDRLNSQAAPLTDEVAGRLSTGISVEDEVIHNHEIKALMRAVRELPKRQWQVVILVKLLECSIEDAAELLEIKPHAVSQALYKAIENLRRRLDNDGWGR